MYIVVAVAQCPTTSKAPCTFVTMLQPPCTVLVQTGNKHIHHYMEINHVPMSETFAGVNAGFDRLIENHS